MFCWTGERPLVAKRQQTRLPAPVLGYLIKYLTSLKSRSEDPLGNTRTATGSLAVAGRVMLPGPGFRMQSEMPNSPYNNIWRVPHRMQNSLYAAQSETLVSLT